MPKDQSLARRILEVEDAYAELGCDVSREGDCTILMSDLCPDMYDSNHVRNINLQGDPGLFVDTKEELFRQMGREHCRFDTDMRTAPESLSSALRDRNYSPSPGVIQVLREGSRIEHKSDAEVIQVASAEGLADWEQITLINYGHFEGEETGFPLRGTELARHRLSTAWNEGIDYRVYLAYDRPRSGGRGGGGEGGGYGGGEGGGDGGGDGGCHGGDRERVPAGTVEAFVSNGIAKIENLFVDERHRERGIAGALLAAAVDDVRYAAEHTYLVAASYDWPRYFYLHCGFEDLTEIISWHKVWREGVDSDHFITFD